MSRLQKLLKPETVERQELRLPLPPERALEACEGVVEALGWGWRRDPDHPGRITVLEDFTKISCDKSPVRMEVEVRPGNGSGASTVKVEATVPGVGGVANSHLNDCMRGFVLRLGRRAQAT